MLFSQATHAMNRFPLDHVEYGDDYVNVYDGKSGKLKCSCKKVGGVVVGSNQKNADGVLVGYPAAGQLEWSMDPIPKNCRAYKHYSAGGSKADHSQGGKGGSPERIDQAEEYAERIAVASKLAEEHGYVPSLRECEEHGYELEGDKRAAKEGHEEVVLPSIEFADKAPAAAPAPKAKKSKKSSK
jgi:hypothetical protein